ncbi:hypothetical protein C8A01DRAFT_40810 [Parachaetomium inaequale]|uniref:Uncharacterized protein n=1 Tax=Parachaetomium inaequale TaxID=2588326 RepID=A0AAN6PB44_9PEZI|nr:hypothetical protein C8A01DRAFT_40810 [Parachaetomium inaequale]
MAKAKYNKHRRAKFRAAAAQAAQAARDAEVEAAASAATNIEQGTSMDVDPAPLAKSSATLLQSAGTATIADTHVQGLKYAQRGESEVEGLDMREVAAALEAAMDDTSEQNLEALIRAVDFDVLKLANLALDNSNMHTSATILLSTAIMMSENKATQAEKKAIEAENKATEAETKAAEAGNKASEAQYEAITAQTNCDGVLARNLENAHALLGQGSHLAQIERRLSALERLPPTPTSSSANNNSDGDTIAALKRMLAITNAQLQAITQDHDKLRETVNKALLTTAAASGPEGTMDDLVGRMQVLADMRREAEQNEFERKDYLRQQEVRGLRDEIALLRKERQETSVLASQFRKMRAYLIAFVGGELTDHELIERLRGHNVAGVI